MVKISIPIDIDAIVDQLPMREKIRLVNRLEQKTWASRLDEVVSRIRARPSVRRLSAEEITRIVEDVRRTRHARAPRRP